MDVSLLKQLEALCSPKGVSTRLREYFFEDGKLRRGPVIEEIASVALAVALGWGLWSTIQSHSYLWAALIAVAFLLALLFCVKPITFAVTSLRVDRGRWEEEYARSPSTIHAACCIVEATVGTDLAAKTAVQKTAISALQAVARSRLQSADTCAFDVAQLVLQCRYVITHPDNTETLARYLMVLRSYEIEPGLEANVSQALALVRSVLVSKFGEDGLTQALQQYVDAEERAPAAPK